MAEYSCMPLGELTDQLDAIDILEGVVEEDINMQEYIPDLR